MKSDYERGLDDGFRSAIVGVLAEVRRRKKHYDETGVGDDQDDADAAAFMALGSLEEWLKTKKDKKK
jgi:hypothetical protein